MGFYHPYPSYGFGWGYGMGWPYYYGYNPYGSLFAYEAGYHAGGNGYANTLPSIDQSAGGSWDTNSVPATVIATPTPEPDTTPTPTPAPANMIRMCQYADTEGNDVTVPVRTRAVLGCPTSSNPPTDLAYPDDTSFCTYFNRESIQGESERGEITLPIAASKCPLASPPTPTPTESITEDGWNEDE